MSTKEIDGKIYILKSEVENIIQSRISKVAKRANDAELQAKELQQKIDENAKSLGTVDLLTQQVADLSQQLEQSNTRYSRHTAIAKHGLTDPDLIEAVEWQYERAQKKLPKKDQAPLADWLAAQIASPDSAPIMLRPHLQTIGAQPTAQPTEQPVKAPVAATPAAVPSPANGNSYPNVNASTRQAPEQGDLLSRALTSPESWKQNKEAIKKWYYNRSRNGINGQ